VVVNAFFRLNKSDISYLRTSQPFDIPIHSRALLVAIVRIMSSWCFCSQSASRRCIYAASASQHPSQTPNCARLRIVATQSNPSQLLKVRSHGNNVIVVHVISADAQIHRRRKRKVILVYQPATCEACSQLVKVKNLRVGQYWK